MNVGLLAQVACILEVTARKPGNVHRFADFPGDAHYLDFLLSAAAIAGPIERASDVGVGGTVLAAVEATRNVVRTNTNLGMILLIVPLACVPKGIPLRDGVSDILARLTVDDARSVYRAIRLAKPGGLGSADAQDVANEPSATLLEVMRIAADRDLVARQYVTRFEDVFEIAVPALLDGRGESALCQNEGLEGRIIDAFVTMLAARPDTLIARKRGVDVAEEASRRASIALASGDLDALDAWLREDGHARNPGATADLIAAALFAALRDGTIALPRPVGEWPLHVS